MSDSSAATAATENHRRHHRRSLSGWLKKIASSAPSPTSRRVAPIPKGYRNSKGLFVLLCAPLRLYRSSCAKLMVYTKTKGVFGVPICESICYARATVGYVDESAIKHSRAGIIPLIIAKCGAFLKEHGIYISMTVDLFVLEIDVLFNRCRITDGRHLSFIRQYASSQCAAGHI